MYRLAKTLFPAVRLLYSREAFHYRPTGHAPTLRRQRQDKFRGDGFKPEVSILTANRAGPLCKAEIAETQNIRAKIIRRGVAGVVCILVHIWGLQNMGVVSLFWRHLYSSRSPT